MMVGKDAWNFDPAAMMARLREGEKMTFDEWMKIGLESGWCGPPVCYTHDGLPMSEEEEAEFEEGDPCVHVIRMYESEEHRAAVEESHSPSQWRNHYTK
jgi:hypothetical protein